jgi:hypothetical protein
VDGGNPAPLLEHNFETSRTLFNIGGGVAPKKKVINGWNPAPPQNLSTLKRGCGVCFVHPTRTWT